MLSGLQLLQHTSV